jgi:DNA modification methylase
MDATITTGDCIKHLGMMPAESVHLVLADPPYNIGIDYGDGVRADKLPDAAYIEWVRRWIKAAARVLAPDGAMWIVCDAAYGAAFDVAIRKAGLVIRDRGVWHETFGTYRGKGSRPNFGKDWRPWFHGIKSADCYTFNFADDDMRVPSKRQELGDGRADPRGRVMSNVWAIPRVPGNSKERVAGVPTQLPLALVRLVVRGFSNPGDLVLDPFTGSGTTGVVCIEHGRRFHGIELRDEFAAIAQARIDKAAASINAA